MLQFQVEIDGTSCNVEGVSIATRDTEGVVAAILAPGNHLPRASAIADAYLAGGRKLEPRPVGETGYFLHDRLRGHSYVVSAPIATRQIYWKASPTGLCLASDPAGVLGAGYKSTQPSPQALYDYVYFHCIPGPSSVHEGVSRLDSGSVIHWDGHTVSVARYWQPQFHELATFSKREAAATLHDLLAQAVRETIGSRERIGTFLSGGLDSSTVTGYAARLRPGIPSITMGFDAVGYDEVEYARVASQHFGTRALEYYVTPDDIVATLPEIAAAFAEPFGNSSAAATYHCARVAREHGLDLLLAGDGGDELFGGNERYAKQLVFERYSAVPLRSSLLEPLITSAARLTRMYPIGKAQSYIEQAKVPLPDRLQNYNFLHRHDPAEVFAPALLGQVDCGTPLRQLRAEYAQPDATTAVNRMLFLDWKFTLHDNDLIKVNTMCDMASIDVAYPMLDQRLIDFSLRMPADWKVRDGELRWFYRAAMKSFLPQRILEKRKHGFGLPFGLWTRTHNGLNELARTSLAALARRGYFRREFLERALRMHAVDHAAYYGELVWILMVLELWLQRHMPDAKL